jgi:hypothetical protein
MALSFGYNTTNNIPKKKSFWTYPYIFEAEDGLSWEFVFLDWTVTGDIGVYTNRTTNVTWECQSWNVIEGGNGTSTNLTVQNGTDGESFDISLPKAGGLDQTTFFTAPDAICGPGCGIVEAFEASKKQSWFYQCNITVGAVQNSLLPEHEMGINLRRMAAGAIALQGFRPSLPGTKQYQVYPSQSTYGQPQGGVEDQLGSQIGKDIWEAKASYFGQFPE